MLLPSQLRPCSLFPNPFPWLLPSYLAGSLCHLHFLLVSITVGGRRSCSWSGGMASCPKLLVGPVRPRSGWQLLCIRHHPLQVPLLSIVEEGCDRERSNERRTRAAAGLLLPVHALTARDFSCILRAASGARRGGQQVAKSRVALRRSFTFTRVFSAISLCALRTAGEQAELQGASAKPQKIIIKSRFCSPKFKNFFARPNHGGPCEGAALRAAVNLTSRNVINTKLGNTYVNGR